jgi:hypothetical protein
MIEVGTPRRTVTEEVAQDLRRRRPRAIPITDATVARILRAAVQLIGEASEEG